jgi:hypothetical protein
MSSRDQHYVTHLINAIDCLVYSRSDEAIYITHVYHVFSYRYVACHKLNLLRTADQRAMGRS